MWKNIKQERPEKDTDYLVVVKIGEDFYIEILAYSTQSDLWTDRDYEDWSKLITHWDNLPKLPHNQTFD